MAHRLLFYKSNFMLAANLERFRDTMLRARAAGYNGVVLDDYKFQILDRLSARYFQHVEEVRRIAAQLELEIFPLVARFGYSNGILAHDPNLAEGVPVLRAPFRMIAGSAAPASAPIRDVRNETVQVTPFRQYHLSVNVKTEGFRAGKTLAAVTAGDGRRIGHFDRLPAPTQDWTAHHFVFNSVANERLEVRPTGWAQGTGEISYKDAALEEVGLINLLRRAGTPLTVSSSDGATIYHEGRDFAIENNRPDGLMPRPGEFDAWHEPSRILALPGSRIRDGETILVSYYHAMMVREGGVICCLSRPEPYEIVRDQIARLQEIFRPRGFFISIDEVRVANWCESCRARKMSPGAMVADTTRRCIAMVREANPAAKIIAWSDMFDPFHNAHDHYYLADGDLAGSWLGLDRDVIVATWNYTAREQSLKWFAERGHPQLVTGFYDRSAGEMEEWARAAAGVPGIAGAMYTTWREDYSQLETFADVLWRRARAPGFDN